MKKLKSLLPHGLAVFASIIFLSSIPYKFTNHANTQEIFGRLNEWATSLGAPGLFAQTGLFSQYVIGSAELVASLLLLTGVFQKSHRLQGLGAMIGIAVMTGAIYFHLFTPLTTDPNNDGGGLFVMAVCVWFAMLALLIIRRKAVLGFLCDVKSALFPKA